MNLIVKIELWSLDTTKTITTQKTNISGELMKNWDTIEDNVHLTKYWELYYIYPRESPTEPAAIR